MDFTSPFQINYLLGVRLHQDSYDENDSSLFNQSSYCSEDFQQDEIEFEPDHAPRNPSNTKENHSKSLTAKDHSKSKGSLESKDSWEEEWLRGCQGMSLAKLMDNTSKLFKVYFFGLDNLKIINSKNSITVLDFHRLAVQIYNNERNTSLQPLQFVRTQIRGLVERTPQQMDSQQKLTHCGFDQFLVVLKEQCQQKQFIAPFQFQAALEQKGQLFFQVTNVSTNKVFKILIQKNKRVIDLLDHCRRIDPSSFYKQTTLIHQSIELSLQLPLLKIRSHELLAVTNKTSQLFRQSRQGKQQQIDGKVFAYEQFQMQKINRKNEKDERIIGVDSDFIHKINPKLKNLTFINSLRNSFSQKKSQLPISEVLSVRQKGGQVQIELRGESLRLEGSQSAAVALASKIKRLRGL